MNNEPVAWMETYKGEPNNLDWDKSNLNYGSEFHDVIPLYTHPVKELDEQFEKGFKAGKEEGWKAHKFHHPVKEQDESFDRTASHMAGEYVSYKKELTDAEIRTIQDMCHLKNVGYNTFIMRFARAILRKAQEKTTQSVMSENCTCYKLGYSQLNDYAKVKAK